eukprot:12427727-Alexandrium_andersonii.AAC.1
MTVMPRLLVRPDGTSTERLVALQQRLCARNEAWGDCIQFGPRRFAVAAKERYDIEHGNVGPVQSTRHH